MAQPAQSCYRSCIHFDKSSI